MKIFKTTIEANNSCYVQTLLVIAPTKERAHELIVESRVDKYTPKPNIVYKSPLTEVVINDAKESIMQIGFASNESNFEGDD